MIRTQYGAITLSPPLRGTSLYLSAILTLWCREVGFSELHARKLLANLDRKALLRTAGKAPARLVSLHSLQYDYLRAATASVAVELHANISRAIDGN